MIQVENSIIRAVLISIMLQKDKKEEVELSLSELEQLAETAEIEVIGNMCKTEMPFMRQLLWEAVF